MNIDKLTEQYLQRISRKDIVEQKSYLDWLYGYVCKNKSIDNECILYSDNEEDVENGILLTNFMEYMRKVSFKQQVTTIWHSNCLFNNAHIFFKIKNKFFECFIIKGALGLLIHINLLEEEPKDKYLIL